MASHLKRTRKAIPKFHGRRIRVDPGEGRSPVASKRSVRLAAVVIRPMWRRTGSRARIWQSAHYMTPALLHTRSFMYADSVYINLPTDIVATMLENDALLANYTGGEKRSGRERESREQRRERRRERQWGSSRRNR